MQAPMLIFLILCFVLPLNLAQDNQDFCITVPRRPEEVPRSSLVGAPGKRGPAGLPGPKGDVGPNGPCVCDHNEQQRMQREIDILKETLAEVVNFVRYEHPLFKCAIGIKDRRVVDADITASGNCCGNNFAPFHARLDNEPTYGGTGAGVWATSPPHVGEWIQVNLRNQTRVTGVVTQGRPACTCNQWVTQFKMSYSNDGVSFSAITARDSSAEIFQGNHDRDTYKINKFNQPITAQYFRLTVAAYHHHASLRMELITC